MFNFVRNKFKKKTKFGQESSDNSEISDDYELSDISESSYELFEKIVTNNAARIIQKIVRKNFGICPICLNNYFHNKNRIILSCGHILHQTCFNNLIIYNYDSCPLCRKSINQIKNNTRRIAEILLDEALMTALARIS